MTAMFDDPVSEKWHWLSIAIFWATLAGMQFAGRHERGWELVGFWIIGLVGTVVAFARYRRSRRPSLEVPERPA
jgi:hypothetical protein